MKRNGHFVICVGNKGYSASLELRKIYQVLPDKAALKLHQIRVIDESGEDYLYPEEFDRRRSQLPRLRLHHGPQRELL